MAEQWYAIVEKLTGKAVSFGTVISDTLPNHLEAIPVDRQPSKSENTVWDEATKTIIDIPVIVKEPLKTIEDLYASLEEIKILIMGIK